MLREYPRPITRISLSHAGPRPWIGRWPPLARALAGRKVGRKMRRNRGPDSMVQLLASLCLLIGLMLAVSLAAPSSAWARSVPVISSSGDPDGGDLSPRPAPSKTPALMLKGDQSTSPAVRGERHFEHGWLVALYWRSVLRRRA